MKQLAALLVVTVVAVISHDAMAWHLPSCPSFSTRTMRRTSALGRRSVMPLRERKLCMSAIEGPPPPLPSLVSETNKALVNGMKGALKGVYGDRYYAYFWALETVARVPYFAYTSVLHLYETLGWSRRADIMKIHFAESWNEQHHLLIMEALGGNVRFSDRFVAQHLAVGYFFFASLLYMLYPTMAYNLNEEVERHAFRTYDDFLKERGEALKSIPAPEVAKEYYQTGDLYFFDEFHTHDPATRRRPRINNLYDVFVEVRNDEREHYLTMEHMQHDFDVISPNQLAASTRRQPAPREGGGASGAAKGPVAQQEEDA